MTMHRSMKRSRLTFLTITLLLGLYCLPASGGAVAPDARPATDTTLDSEEDSLRSQLAALDRERATLQEVRKQVADLPKQDREAVLFRLDERSFDVLQRLGQVIRLAAQLRPEDTQRINMENRLRGDLANIGNSAFASIASLDRRITDFTNDLGRHEGGQLGDAAYSIL